MNERIVIVSLAPVAVMTMLAVSVNHALAADMSRFLKPKAWQCTFEAEMKEDISDTTGAGGMANDSQRQFFKALENSGTQVESPGGDTDSYRQVTEHSIAGEIRLDYVYDGGIDGIQIAGWGNGGAKVHAESRYEGSEQNGIIIRDKSSSFDGFTPFAGDEYEPAFQVWIYPEDGVYALEYALEPVTATQVEHCRMKEGLEGDRQKAESATDADMPLGDFMSGLTQFTCATEKVTEVQLEGGAFSGFVEDIPLPRFGAALEGEGQSVFVDSANVNMRWSCRPE